MAESSGKDVEPVDPEECYRKYVKDKCHEYRKQFIKELESQRKKITDLANTQQREYDEFIRRDLVNVFVSAIDRLKFEKGKKIPPVVENKLKEIFDIIGIEEIPVEIEKTKADARLHMIEETKTGDYEDGTVIGIHFRGIRYKIDEKVIKKPVVVRGEKG